MSIGEYPREIVENLEDLATSGIHLTNSQGVCHVCGQEIDPDWSSGISLDAMCKQCDEKEFKYGRILKAYSHKTVWVKKVLSDHSARESFHAIVKIDGRLCHLQPFGGSAFAVNDLESGKSLSSMEFLNHLTPFRLEELYDKQLETTVHAYVIQFEWLRHKDAVSIEMNRHVNWAAGKIPIYDLGHGGRGWEDSMPGFVRLYIDPSRSNNCEDDFELLHVQLARGFNEPFLDGYEVRRFPDKIVNLKWQQAGPAILAALSSIQMDKELEHPELKSEDGLSAMQRIIAKVVADYQKASLKWKMPTDAWITLIVGDDMFRDPSQPGISHILEHILVHPND